MINLLPPQIKDEIRYSRRNASAINYVALASIVFLLLAGGLIGARIYLKQQISAAAARTTDKQRQAAGYNSIKASAANINDRLNAIQGIQKSQAKFSILLADLAQNMPQGTSISALSLTGDAKKPVRLTVQSTDYKTALGFRDSIARSKRISAADIESIKGNPSAGRLLYDVTVTFSFNPGGAK